MDQYIRKDHKTLIEAARIVRVEHDGLMGSEKVFVRNLDGSQERLDILNGEVYGLKRGISVPDRGFLMRGVGASRWTWLPNDSFMSDVEPAIPGVDLGGRPPDCPDTSDLSATLHECGHELNVLISQCPDSEARHDLVMVRTKLQEAALWLGQYRAGTEGRKEVG